MNSVWHSTRFTACAGPHANCPRSSRLLHRQYPSPSNASTLIWVCRRLMNANQCPLNGSSPRWLLTRADSPSKEQRMSVGCVHNQMRLPGATLNTPRASDAETGHGPVQARHPRQETPKKPDARPWRARRRANPRAMSMTAMQRKPVMSGSDVSATSRKCWAPDRGARKNPCVSRHSGHRRSPERATRLRCAAHGCHPCGSKPFLPSSRLLTATDHPAREEYATSEDFMGRRGLNGYSDSKPTAQEAILVARCIR